VDLLDVQLVCLVAVTANETEIGRRRTQDLSVTLIGCASQEGPRWEEGREQADWEAVGI